MTTTQFDFSLQQILKFFNAISHEPTLRYRHHGERDGYDFITFERIVPSADGYKGAGERRSAIVRVKWSDPKEKRIKSLQGFRSYSKEFSDIDEMTDLEGFIARRVAANAVICRLLAGAGTTLRCAASSCKMQFKPFAFSITPHDWDSFDEINGKPKPGTGSFTAVGLNDKEVVIKMDEVDRLVVSIGDEILSGIRDVVDNPYTPEAVKLADIEGDAQPSAMAAVGELLIVMGAAEPIIRKENTPQHIKTALQKAFRAANEMDAMERHYSMHSAPTILPRAVESTAHMAKCKRAGRGYQ